MIDLVVGALLNLMTGTLFDTNVIAVLHYP